MCDFNIGSFLMVMTIGIPILILIMIIEESNNDDDQY
jgi:hypothetical protein